MEFMTKFSEQNNSLPNATAAANEESANLTSPTSAPRLPVASAMTTPPVGSSDDAQLRGLKRAKRAVAIQLSVVRAAFGSVRYLLRLALTLRLSSLKVAAMAELRLWRARSHIRRSGVFDSEFYRAQFTTEPDDLILHYIRHGASEGRWPNPLFDSPWYIAHNGDVRSTGINPLLHYILTWKDEGRRVNKYFDPRWYLIANSDARKSGLDPITHYLTLGSKRGADPSPEFDTRWYLEQNGDVAAAGTNPLAHYLHHGRREGRYPRMYATRLADGKPVEDAELHCLQFRPFGREVALFVTHSPDGRIKPHLRHYLEALSAEGVDIVLIIAADQPFRDDEGWLRPLVKGLFVRQNTGLDFAAWAHVLRRHRTINDVDVLYLLNDSLVGPTNQHDFHVLIDRIRTSDADIVGLTANHERGWHIQSFFLAIKRTALASFAFNQFCLDIVSFVNKDDVINNFEIQLAKRMIDAGLDVAVLFEPFSIHNSTIYHWRELIQQGFPFIKVMTIRDEIDGVDTTGWREVLKDRGFDVTLADALLADLVSQRSKPTARHSGALFSQSHGPVQNSPRVGFFGPWNFNNGLGVASRGYVSALMQTPFETAFSSVHRPFHVHGRLAPSIDFGDFDGGCDFAVIHMNPMAWDALLDERQTSLIAQAQYRIGLFVWESTTIPAYMVEGLRQVDRIWTPSNFCAQAFGAVTDKPIDVIPHIVDVASNETSHRGLMHMRRTIGLAEEERVILYIFDASSYLARKNPEALVRAFKESRLAKQGWKLILKTKNLDMSSPSAVHLTDLIRDCAGAILLQGNMSTVQLSALLDLCDVYASSHASEGFGLTIAEALARGKRVVATDYGGSRDFLNEETGFPVLCLETSLEVDDGAYERGTVWAKVDEDHLSSSLILAAMLSPPQIEARKRAARNIVRETLSSKVVAARIQASLEVSAQSLVGPIRQ